MISHRKEFLIDGYTANLSVYLWEGSDEFEYNTNRPIILICPGGGYAMVSKREGDPIAFSFLAAGFQVAVLDYSVAPAEYPVALLQLAAATAYLRENALTWNADPDKIIVCGFSAGGHLAANLAVAWNDPKLRDASGHSNSMLKPNGLILGYPVISSGEYGHQDSFKNLLGSRYEKKRASLSLENLVTGNTPKTFIWHTYSDNVVPVQNTLLFVDALCKNGVEVESHIYPKGCHGLALANELTTTHGGGALEKDVESWMQLAITWVRHL